MYDASGEKVASFCGTGNFAAGTTFSMALSNFVPNPVGAGGSIAVNLNGQTIATWDVTGLNGKLVPNGFYHFVIQEHTAEGNTLFLERDAFLMPYHGQDVSLSALPNIGHPGGVIQFVASFVGTLADGQSKIRIYAVSGELVQTLGIQSGTAAWDLSNIGHKTVASGIYLAVLDGVDPVSGQQARKIVKVMVTH